MDRKIKFRVFDTLVGEMIGDNMHVIGESFCCGRIEAWINDHESEKGMLERYNDMVVMQYTGLQDKEGNDICEGDIIQFRDELSGIWRDVVTLEDGVFTVSRSDVVQVENPEDWEQEYDWVKSRWWSSMVGYGERGTWNSYRQPLTSMSGISFDSSDKVTAKITKYGAGRYINVEVIGNKFENPELLEN